MRRTVLAVARCLAARRAGCLLEERQKDIDPPAELADFPASLRVQRAWDASVGGKGEKMRLGLGVTVDGGRVFAAGRGGEVGAWDLQTGKKLWEARTKAALSGGTGAGEGLVAVGTSDGVLIALNAQDGAERWRTKLNGEVLSAPEVSARAVLVRTVDGKLHSLAPDTGKEIWQYEQQSPRLTLRGTSSPVVVGDAVICGFDNGKIVALNIPDGALLRETTIASAHGRTELGATRRYRFGGEGHPEQRVRRGLPGSRGDAGARLGADLVGAGCVELSRARCRCRQRLCVDCGWRCGRA